eukprot:COSAG05_NODE_15098_length_378_cov_1.125448_1_plen_92_part_10
MRDSSPRCDVVRLSLGNLASDGYECVRIYNIIGHACIKCVFKSQSRMVYNGRSINSTRIIVLKRCQSARLPNQVAYFPAGCYSLNKKIKITG